MKRCKRIFGSAVFLAIGLAMTVLVCYILRPLDGNFFRRRFAGFYGEKDDTLDVVALGSSALYRYFCSPQLYEYTGLTSYSLGTAGQPIFALENLIDEVYKTQSPQLLVIESRKFLLKEEKSALESRIRMVTDNMYYSANRISLINEMVDSWDERLSYYFDIMMYHENWENVNLESLRFALNSAPHPLKSWANVSKHRTLEKPDLMGVTEEVPLSEASEEALLGILEKCQEENLQVLFVLTPYEIDRETQKRSNYLKRVVEEHGFRLLDGNLLADDMGIDYGVDFYNKRHTNSLGAEKFTRYLGEYILENYDLDVNHSPEVTAEWDSVAQENRVLFEQAGEKIRNTVQAKLQAKAE